MLPQPAGSLAPTQQRLSIAVISVKCRSNGYPALASWPFRLSLVPWRHRAQPMCWSKVCSDGGMRKGEMGVGGVKRRIRGFILLSVITVNQPQT